MPRPTVEVTGAFVDAVPCGLARLDAAGTVVWANDEMVRLAGVPVAELVNVRSLASLLSTAGRILNETHLRPMLAHSGRVREVSLELVRPDGSRVPVLMSARLLAPGEDGSVAVVLLETRDRHRYESDLREATRAAEDARRRTAELAETLQQTLIPPRPPAIPGLDIGACYRPAGSGGEVGGDFYDVFQVAPEEWFVVVGDVSGKGVPAAVVTSFVRYTLRGLTAVHRDPARVLGLLDEAMQDHESERYCTLALVHLARAKGRWQAALSLAGHPPALVRRGDGAVIELGEPGTPVGLVTTPAFHTVRWTLGEETVVLYTDGVTEARGLHGLFGEDRLVDLVAGLPGDPPALVEAVARAVLEWQSGDASDDIAVVGFAPSVV